MKKLLMILLVLGIVFVSGCTGGGTTSSSDGILIKSFIIDPPQVEGGETVWFILDIQNVGGSKATGVTADLVGLPVQWGTPQTKGGNDIGELLPPEQGLEGEIASVEWSLTAPPSQTTIKYPVESVVNYHYQTHTEALVRVATRDWIRSLPQDNQQDEMNKLGQIQKSPEGGPIQTEIKVRSGTVYAGKDFRVILDIRNQGNGRPKDDIVNISPKGFNCDEEGNIKLIQGKSRQVRCTVDTSGIDSWKNLRLDVDLDYDYSVRDTKEVTVIGSPSS